LAKVWERQREFEVSLYARLDATLRNTAIDVAFKPPAGKFWTPDMLMPGYKTVSDPAEEWDWKAEKAKMHLIGKRPEPAKIKADLEARRETQGRFRMAEEAKARGASAEEIRLIMEA